MDRFYLRRTVYCEKYYERTLKDRNADLLGLVRINQDLVRKEFWSSKAILSYLIFKDRNADFLGFVRIDQDLVHERSMFSWTPLDFLETI
jgi:hypothetical protein